MKVTYTGQQEQFTPAQKKKLDARLAKLGKLLDLKGGEREAHIILTSERHLRRAEITVRVLVEASSEEPGGKRVFRVDEQRYRKPMTIEEAMLEMDRKRDYVVFRDAETDRVSVLLRRRDGHFDIVEG